MDNATREQYVRIRRDRPDVPAKYALQWARHEVEVTALQAVAEWDGEYRGDGYPMRTASIGNVRIDVWADEVPYDWGDIEPTDDEREHLEVIGVSVRLADDDATTALDACWGIGYDGRTSDMEREALSFAVTSGYFDHAQTEVRERAEWAARDTITV